VLIGKCPLYEVEPPCVIPQQRHLDLLYQMGSAHWPRKYADAEWDRCAAKDELLEWVVNRPRPGLLVHGPVGTGKSSALGLVARSLWKEAPVVFTSWADYGDLLSFDSESIRELRGAKFLAIDDFGTVDHPSWVIGRFDALVEYRYSNGRPFLVTTNLSPATLRKESDWQRFVDRWGETMIVVSMPGKSLRSK
jgi:DNA replication protein DnaC